MCILTLMSVCVRACVCVRARVRACVRACVCVYIPMYNHYCGDFFKDFVNSVGHYFAATHRYSGLIFWHASRRYIGVFFCCCNISTNTYQHAFSGSTSACLTEHMHFHKAFQQNLAGK